MGQVVSINISEKKGVSKKEIPFGIFIERFGLKDDAHGGDWHRQVSLLAQESIDKMIALGLTELIAGSFAENITTMGIELHTLPIGTKLKIGETLHEVTQIGKTCHSKCAIFHQVGKCIMPTEGIFTKVLKGGQINPNDVIEIVNN